MDVIQGRGGFVSWVEYALVLSAIIFSLFLHEKIKHYRFIKNQYVQLAVIILMSIALCMVFLSIFK